MNSPDTHTSTGALAGVRVLDLTTVMAGPATTQMLCDMGAQVTKVETAQGDIIRRVGPSRHDGMGTIFLQNNRGKRSIVLDLKHPQGRECLLRLARDCDVLVYNIRPQAMQRLGLGYEELSRANPRIIYAGIYGYDERGPYAGRPAYDDLIQSLVALPTLAMMAGNDRPRFMPLAIVDRYVASVAVGIINGALVHALKSGQGQRVDISMFETMAQLVLSDHFGGRTFEPPLGPPGYSRTLSPERVPYPTLDGHLSMLAYTDAQWHKFFAMIERPELSQDPRFVTMTERTIHIDALYKLVGQSLRARTTAQWLELLTEADIPAAPLNTLDSLIDDPHLAQIGFFKPFDHPSEGPLRQLASPVRWSRTPPAPPAAAPRLGEHSCEVLGEAGYSREEIDRLVAQGVTLDGAAPAASAPAD